MKSKPLVTGSLLVVLSVLVAWLFAIPDVPASVEFPRSAEAIERGAYLTVAGGCVSCHRSETDPETFSGGLALETDFGVFYAPNITPDKATGIGNWTAQEFILALKHGRSPSGSFYYPVFPYRAYGGLPDQALLEIGAYLRSLEPVSKSTPEPEIPLWLARWNIALWNTMADFKQPKTPDYDDELIARGAYLARNLGHCGECHTPRNRLGIPDLSREFFGAELGEEVVEPIDAAALESWSTDNFALFLLIGLKPDGEFVGGDMNDVIEHNTSKLTDEDREALAAFFTRRQ